MENMSKPRETKFPKGFCENERAKGQERLRNCIWKGKDSTRFSQVEERERDTQRERVNPCSFIKKEKEMPQLELNNVPKWAELPTGVATGQIISTASTQSSFKLVKNVQMSKIHTAFMPKVYQIKKVT